MRSTVTVSAPRVEIVPAPPTPAQARAWAKLWAWLLAGDDAEAKKSNAPCGKQGAFHDGTKLLAQHTMKGSPTNDSTRATV
jgi:hypothetical protein